MKTIRWFLAAACAAVLISFVPSCSCGQKCGPGTCAGCCDSAGTCQAGALANACGANGTSCTVCAPTQTCSGGFCTGGGTGGGSGGGAGGGGGGGGVGTLTFDQFCSQFSDAYCSLLVTCKVVDPAGKADCITYFTRFVCDSSRPSVNKGYQSFDGNAGSACVASMQSASCNTGTGPGDACNSVMAGASGQGQGCYSRSDCKDTLTCSGTGCSKSCKSSGGLNEPCNYGFCDTGYWCDKATDTCRAPQGPGGSCSTSWGYECDGKVAYCDTTQKLCVALPGNGQPCRSSGYPECNSTSYCDYAATPDTCRSRLSVGQQCSSTYQCVDTAFCDYSQSPWSCQPRRASGGNCTSSDQCQSGLRCQSNLCTPLAPEGQRCASGSDCQTSLSCDDVLRTCQTFAGVDAGASCTDDTRYCRGGDYNCKGAAVNPDGGVGTVGTCALKALNDPCTSHYDCPDQSFCNAGVGGSGTCQAAVSGSPCSSSTNCPANHYCATSKLCSPLIAQGQPCDPRNYQSCQSPTQCKTVQADGGSVCGEPGGANSSCLTTGSSQCKFPYECVSGLCTSVGHSGERCAQQGFCISGACSGRNADAGIPGTCGPYFTDGQTCRDSYECASLRCELRTCQAACP